jgi:sulfite reductase beta subunit-like hemoprotein
MQHEFGIHMKGGVITERDYNLTTVRIRAPAGVLTIRQLRGIAEIAKKYGSGVVHCTTRQTIEIPHVNPKSLKRVAQRLEKNGTLVGSEKDEVVNIISCPRTERCKYANINTISLAKRIDEKLFVSSSTEFSSTQLRLHYENGTLRILCTAMLRLTVHNWHKGRMYPDRDPLLKHIHTYQNIQLWFFLSQR